MDGWLKYLIILAYQGIKEAVQEFTGLSGLLVDLVSLGIGYWKRDTDWGEGLFYGAMASFGRELTAGIIRDLVQRVAPRPQAQQAQVQTQAFSNVRWY